MSGCGVSVEVDPEHVLNNHCSFTVANVSGWCVEVDEVGWGGALPHGGEGDHLQCHHMRGESSGPFCLSSVQFLKSQ